MLFYGQIDTTKQIDETTFQQLFTEAESLLIGQGKAIDVGNDQFVIVNHEDIVSGMHVADVYKHDEKDALALLTKLGKAFKNQFQSEIDEFKPESCDLTTTFGDFSGPLVSILNEFFAQKESKSASKSAKLVPRETSKAVTPAEPSLSPDAGKESSAPRYPGGIIEPEQLDEALFHEYEQLMNIYNVEMVDGIISRNKIYLFSTAIDVDYSEFPQCPKIKMPSNAANVLSLSQKYQNWNAEDPPRVIDLINEIEQLLGSYQPSGSTQADRAAEVEAFVEDLGYNDEEKRKERNEKKTASITLADRLLSKEKKEVKQKPAQPVIDYIPDQDIGFEEEPIKTELEISKKADVIRKKTPLQDMVNKEKIEETQVEAEPRAEPAPAPAKPVKFVIRPKFVVDGEEVGPEPVKQPPKQVPAKDKAESKPIATPLKSSLKISGESRAPSSSKPAPKAVTQAKASSEPEPVLKMKSNKINTSAKPGLPSAKKFEIPSVHELDSFVPKTSVKKPELKTAVAPTRQGAIQTKKALVPAKPEQKPAKQAASVKPASVEKKAASPSKPRAKPKDDGVMPGWDDGGEIEMKQANEIKDFDMPIKKVDSKKEDTPQDVGGDDSS